jgi:protein Mpv17
MIVPLTAGKPLLVRRLLQRRSQLSTPFKRSQSNHSQTNKCSTTPASDAHNAKSTSASRTIPGPIWIWTEPLNSYSRLHSRRPYTLQIISATIIYLIGDLFAQSVAPTPSLEASTSSPPDDAVKKSTYDPARTARALVIGSSAAVPGYHWFLYLAHNFNYKSKVISIVVKVLINQVVFTPIFNSYFFGMHSALSGASASEIVERIKHTVPRSWINSWKLWPVVTAFSFAFVRVELRGLFAGQSYIASGCHWRTPY